VIIGGLVAAFVTATLGLVVADQQLVVTVAAVLASMFYFSRNPWGGNEARAERTNERIDRLYDRVLP